MAKEITEGCLESLNLIVPQGGYIWQPRFQLQAENYQIGDWLNPLKGLFRESPVLSKRVGCIFAVGNFAPTAIV